MAFDVFISYPHQDKAAADATCARLESDGIRCWIAPRDIVHGMDWGEAIIDAIAGAKVMVLIFSGHANASPQITREVERAVNKRMPIIPVRIENVAPTRSLEYFISTSHWLDALTPPLEDHLRKLSVSVKSLLQLKGPGIAAMASAAATEPFAVKSEAAVSSFKSSFHAAKSAEPTVARVSNQIRSRDPEMRAVRLPQLVEGAILVILGMAAIVMPVIATFAFAFVVGWLFLISGVVGLFTTFYMRGAPGFGWSLISAIVTIAAGIALLGQTVSAAISATLVLIAFFVIEGIATIMYAIAHRAQLSGRWGLMLASGIVDLILAGIIFAGLPGTADWALGLLVGINMVFGGIAMIGMALAAKKPG